MELDYKAIGKRIKIARINADMTQEQLSEAVGLSPTHLSNIETGTTHVSLNAIVNLANALSVTTDALLCDSIIKARPQIEQDIAAVIADCDRARSELCPRSALQRTFRTQAVPGGGDGRCSWCGRA